MGAMEDAANLFSADMNPGARPATQRETDPTPVDDIFGNQVMEGDADAGYGQEGVDEGGDADEEASNRPEPKRGDDGRFLKNEGPIDDGEGEGDGERTDEGGEQEEDGEPSEPTSKAAQIDPETRVRVKIDGEEKEVTFKEATEGYIRTQTFHKRLTELDQEKQVVDRTRGEYQQVLQATTQTSQQLLAQLKALEPAEPDWDKLYRESPNEAARQKIMWDRYNDGKKQLEQQQQDLQQQQQQERQRNLQHYVAGEANKLLQKFPHWKDNAARERDQQAIKGTLKSAGFSDAEVSQVFDSRMVEIAMKAARFDRLSSKKLVPRASTNRPMPSGAAASQRRSGSAAGNRAIRAHSQTQTVESAAGAFADILSREG